MMTPAELRAAGRLGGLAFGGLVSRIEQVHQAIGHRAFGPAGPAGAPTRLVHDAIARGTYLTVKTAGTVAGTAGHAASLLGAGGQPAGREPGRSGLRTGPSSSAPSPARGYDGHSTLSFSP
jgi:hypothetical protein